MVQAIANFENDALYQEYIEAVCSNKGYSSTIPNPDFDPNKEISADNPKTIPNPETAGDFVVRMFAEGEVALQIKRYRERKAKRAHIDPITSEVAEEVKAIKAVK
jgi:hypothetical protein